MTQPVRPDVGGAADGRDGLMHHGAGLTRVESPPAWSEQQRGAGPGMHQRRTAVGKPGVQCTECGPTEGDGALLVSLAQHSQQPPARIDVVDVEAAQLTDPDAGGVEHLDDQPVPQGQRIALFGAETGRVHRRLCLVLTKHRREGPVGFGNLQPSRRVRCQQAAPGSPGGEGLDR